jgi:hypothetical protein
VVTDEMAQANSKVAALALTSVVTSKAAMRGQGKIGHARKPSRFVSPLPASTSAPNS